MSVNYNKVIIGGNLTRDPVAKELPGGRACCEFSVATNESWKDKDGNKQERTTFADVVVYGGLADVVTQYKVKGDSVLVDGRLEQQRWEDKDGNKRSRMRIVANDVRFVSSGERRERAEQAEPQQQAPVAPSGGPVDDEPPF